MVHVHVYVYQKEIVIHVHVYIYICVCGYSLPVVHVGHIHSKSKQHLPYSLNSLLDYY